MVRNFRKPLIVVAPKTMLRLSAATSALSDMSSGTSFMPVLGDTEADPAKVTRVLLCTGKHYYALNSHRSTENINNTAIIRLEVGVNYHINSSISHTFLYLKISPKMGVRLILEAM